MPKQTREEELNAAVAEAVAAQAAKDFQTIEDLKAVHRRTQAALAKAKERSEDLVEVTYSAAKDAVMSLGPIPPVKAPKQDNRPRPEAALIHWTDWQGGKKTPTYDSDVMRLRVMESVGKIEKITEIQRKAHPVRHCLIALGGDMCEGAGFNFPTQPWEMDSGIFDQIATISRVLVEAVRECLRIYETVEVVAEWGNHGRIGSKHNSILRKDNFDRIIYEFARVQLSGEARLVWKDCPEDIQQIVVGNYRSLLIHGDEVGKNGFASKATISMHCTKWLSGSYRPDGNPWPFRDVYCVDPETRALTPDGWRRYDEIGGSLIATMNPETDAFEWQYPIINTFEYEGMMINHVGRSMDHFATPDHDMYVKHHGARSFQKTSAAKVHGSTNWMYRAAPTKWSGEWVWDGPFKDACPEDLAELVGWYVSEGHASKHQFTIAQSLEANPEKHQRILALMKRVGMKKASSQKFFIRHCSKDVADWFRENFGDGSRFKKLPNWVKNWPTEHLARLVEAMRLGDGWTRIDDHSFGCSTLSEQLSADIQEIGFKLGFASTHSSRLQKDRAYITHTVTLSRSPIRRIPKTRTEIQYSGIVWCPTVPNGLWLANRNGRTAVSGNCGHYHTHEEYAMPNGTGAVYFTGSTESDNRYAGVNLASSAHPSQRLHFIDPDKGRVTSQFKILLGE